MTAPATPAALAAAREIRQALFSDNELATIVLEGSTHVAEKVFAEIIARHTSAPEGEREGDGWRPMETAPKDGTAILAVIGLYRRDQSFSHWDIHIIAFDQDRGAISPDHDQGWDWEDYEGWQPLPAPPLAPQEAGR